MPPYSAQRQRQSRPFATGQRRPTPAGHAPSQRAPTSLRLVRVLQEHLDPPGLGVRRRPIIQGHALPRLNPR